MKYDVPWGIEPVTWARLSLYAIHQVEDPAVYGYSKPAIMGYV